MGDVPDDCGQGYIEVMSQSLPSSPRSFIDECHEPEELRGTPRLKSRKRLSKQLSMCETSRDLAWEKRRHQIMRQGRMAARSASLVHGYLDDITDEDLNELKGCIDLGFGFKEEDREMLPALDIYFAVNRQLTTGSTGSTPRSLVSSSSSSSLGGQSSSSSSSSCESESWRICNPGDDPQQVKTKLRHWAQAVACSVRQSL